MALSLLTIKPHILHLLLALWWIIRERRWRVVLGGALHFAISRGRIISPAVFGQYLAERGRPSIGARRPCIRQNLSSALSISGCNIFLMALASLPFAWLVKQGLLRAITMWLVLIGLAEIAPLSLVGSALTASYGWTFDKVILLPAVFAFLSLRKQIARWRVCPSATIYWAQFMLFVILARTSFDESVTYAYPILFPIIFWQININSKIFTRVTNMVSNKVR